MADYAKFGRYKYDPIMASMMTALLYDYERLSSNELRRKIREDMYDYTEARRKTKRSTDRNSGYTPSESKISATVEELVKRKWIERNDTSDPRNSNFRGLSKVFYSLSEYARFAASLGSSPNEYYLIGDLYQMILRAAALGIHSWTWDKEFGINRLTRTEGTTIDDIYLKKDALLFANFNHRSFIIQEIEPTLEDALKKNIVRKKLINHEVRYVINPVLKDYVATAWWKLYPNTLNLVKHVFILKGFSKKDPMIKEIYQWLFRTNDEVHVNNLIQKWREEKRMSKDERIKRIDNIQKFLDIVITIKNKLLFEFENKTDKESLEFDKVRKSVLSYACPDYLVAVVRDIIENKNEN
jgi:hypothetical protein